MNADTKFVDEPPVNPERLNEDFDLNPNNEVDE